MVQGMELIISLLNLLLTFKITNEMKRDEAKSGATDQEKDVLYRVLRTGDDYKL